MIDLDALEALEKAATAGKWEMKIDKSSDSWQLTCRGQRMPIPSIHEAWNKWSEDDIAFIAATRNAMSALLRELRVARAVVAAAAAIRDPREPRDRGLTWTPTPEHYALYQALRAYDAAVKGGVKT